jgi:PKD repeat protein
MSGDIVAPGSEEVLIDNIPSPNGNHNAGDVKFGKDGYLYISVGDGGCDYAEKTKCQYENDSSRDRHVLLGKVLRITPDGAIPSDNPYMGLGSDRCNATGRTSPGNDCQETFAQGFRNPFRMAFDPDATGTSFRINDVGGQRWEEIDDGEAGADYGWNVCEGNHDNPYRSGSAPCNAAPYTAPIHEYNHDTGCESVTGGAFVPDGVWPTSYDHAYLFGDYVCGKIFGLAPGAGGGFSKTEFASGLGPGGPVTMSFGPYETGEALYYATFANGGEVRRIAHTAGNQAPTADVAANPPYSPPPELTINLDSSASYDPDGNTPLTYIWGFGDGTTLETTETATISHTYATAGKYTVTLKVMDSLGRVSAPDTVEVFPGDTPPEPKIKSPATDALFKVRQEIMLQGSATDAEDGQLMDASLEWEILQHHDGNHTHSFLSETGNDLTFTAPAPENLFSTDPAGNYLEIRLTATDSQGLSESVVRELRPKTVEIRFEAQPRNFKLMANGETFRTPRTFVSWEGFILNVSAPRQKDRRGRIWVFSSWSDGAAKNHTITTPADPTTYTATFRRLHR